MVARLFIAVGLVAFAGAEPALATPQPKVGRTALVNAVSGTVRVKDRGDHGFHVLSGSPELIHMGAEIDATGGKVGLRTATGHGPRLRQGVFSRGSFSITQAKGGDHLTSLSLTRGDPSVCASGWTSPGVQRQLLGVAGVGYQAVGAWGEAETVKPATEWVTEDLCNGTFSAANSGEIAASARGQLPTSLHQGEYVEYFCYVGAIAAVSAAFCIDVFYAPALGIWVAGIANQGGDETTYDLCVTDPAGTEQCDTYPFSEPYGDNVRQSKVSCPGRGPGTYYVRWILGGVDLQPAFAFKLGGSPGQGCLHAP